jgi:hypothetical protein
MIKELRISCLSCEHTLQKWRALIVFNNIMIYLDMGKRLVFFFCVLYSQHLFVKI